MDLKIGMPFNMITPYARLGMTESWPNVRLYGGLGIEYKDIKQFSVATEWAANSRSRDATKRVMTAWQSASITTFNDLWFLD